MRDHKSELLEYQAIPLKDRESTLFELLSHLTTLWVRPPVNVGNSHYNTTSFMQNHYTGLGLQYKCQPGLFKPRGITKLLLP